MPDASDIELLRNYDRNGSEEAFAELVRRHINLVYSSALRHVGIAAHAEEITQAVFVILSRKAASLRSDTILDAWLYETTRLTSLSFLRGERRRQWREQEAFMQSTLQESPDTQVWNQLAPLLDEAMSRLGKKDREAVVLRFFRGKSLHEVAAVLNTTETAAQSRVHRAVEKLHKFFLKRGIDSTTTAITGAISAHSVQAAPVALAKSVSVLAITKGAAASGSTLTLIKGALAIMAWSKAKTIIVIGAGLLLAGGTATVTVREFHEHRTSSWQVQPASSELVDQQPPQDTILSSRFTHAEKYGGTDNDKFMATGITAKDVVATAYGSDVARTVFDPAVELPDGLYDFLASRRSGNAEALQAEVKSKFGVTGKYETREMDVLLLKLKSPDAPGLKPNPQNYYDTTISQTPGQFHCENGTLESFADLLEQQAGIPIIDRTGLADRFDIDFNYAQTNEKSLNLDNMNQALIDQLGLELVPSRESIKVLVVEKTN